LYNPIGKHRAVNRLNDFWKKKEPQKFQDVGIKPTRKYIGRTRQLPEKVITKEIFRSSRMNASGEWRRTSANGGKLVEKLTISSSRAWNLDETLYNQELHKWIRGYTNTLISYNLFFIPNESGLHTLLTYWLIFPGMLSLLIFVGGFLFALYFLEKRWGYLRALEIFLASVVVSGFIFICALPFTYFDRYGDTPFMGASLSLALLLGAACMERKNFSVPKPIIIVCGIFLFLDMLVNWTMNPDLFGLVTFLSPVFFGGGALIGRKMPPPKKTAKELAREKLNSILQKKGGDPIAERKARARADLDEGFGAANRAEYGAASKSLTLGFSALLQEYPLDVEFFRQPP
jgi:hypothetical protein